MRKELGGNSMENTGLLREKPEIFRKKVTDLIFRSMRPEADYIPDASLISEASAVLFLLGPEYGKNSDICLILNKRSVNVGQPGDLCCPGGGLMPVLDDVLARLVTLPGFPMRQWPYWSAMKKQHPPAARSIANLFAAGLREGLEEMQLNPFRVRFLGPLPHARLVLFRRVIYPLAAWVSGQKRFFPNWEVEKVVYIPLRCLLNPAHYALYRVQYSARAEEKIHRKTQDFPCFLYECEGEREILWGATFRIVMNFLQLVFGFTPPDAQNLPVISGTIRKAYLTGKR